MHERPSCPVGKDLCSWTPACAGVTLKIDRYALALAFDLPPFLGALGGALVISNASSSSFRWTRTSPPWTSFQNSSSSASGCLIFSWLQRPIGRAPYRSAEPPSELQTLLH